MSDSAEASNENVPITTETASSAVDETPPLENEDHNIIEGDEGSPNNPEDEHQQKRSFFIKLFIAVLLIGFIAYIIVDSLTTGYVRDVVTTFLEWIEENAVAGIFVFMLVYFVATVLFIPGSILTLGAGFVFANAFGLGAGVLLGTLSVFFGASAGALAAFLLGRYLLRDWVGKLAEKYAIFTALDIAFQEKGLRIMVLLRLSPVIPFNAINYVAGVTAIRFWQYTVAMIAILPGTILYVFLGASAGSLADSSTSGDNTTVTIVVIVVGVVFGILAVGVTSYYAKKELNKVAENRRAENEQEGDNQEANSIEHEHNSTEQEDPEA